MMVAVNGYIKGGGGGGGRGGEGMLSPLSVISPRKLGIKFLSRFS